MRAFLRGVSSVPAPQWVQHQRAIAQSPCGGELRPALRLLKRFLLASLAWVICTADAISDKQSMFFNRWKSRAMAGLLAAASAMASVLAVPAQAQIFESSRASSSSAGGALDGVFSHASPALPLAAGSSVQTPHVRAELLAHAPDGIRSGGVVQLGLLMEHAPGWHTYWQNPGDSGMATELQWQLPTGFTPGAIAWPTPLKMRLDELANYGYEGRVLLPVPVHVPANWQATAPDVEIRLDATWLACRLECIPEQGSLTLRLPVDVPSAAWAGEFAQAARAQPVPLAVQGHAAASGDTLHVRVEGLPPDWHGQSLEVFAQQPQVLRHGARAGHDWQQRWEQGAWLAELPLALDRADSGPSLPLVLSRLSQSEGGQWDPHAPDAFTGPIGWAIELPVTAGWQGAERATLAPELVQALAQQREAQEGGATTGAAASAASGAAATPPAAQPLPATQPPLSLAQWGVLLLLALLGGAVLNLMPCVFPVLAIKALALARYSQNRRLQRESALAYGAGVVLSFTVLGALVLALQAAGQQLGWGFQLQSPWFVAGMALLFTLIGLTLAGIVQLHIGLPERLRSAKAGGDPHSPVGESFFSGVLAVLVAAPCTGPFMGAALGATLTLPAAAALAIFVAIGLGLALPFMALVWFPRALDALPRPGAWMETFRNAMAWPMFATVAWLLWVLAHQVGVNAMIAWLFVLWGLGFALWLWGKRPAAGAALALRGLWWLALAVPVAVALAGGHHLGKTIAVQARQPVVTATTQEPGEQWQAWSLQEQQRSLQEGRPVFVDFTASWCITCQYNKATTLADADVLADFARAKVRLLRADWTRSNPEITRALHALGRTGVPTYALHVPGQPVQVMTEILDKAALRAQLAALVP